MNSTFTYIFSLNSNKISKFHFEIKTKTGGKINIFKELKDLEETVVNYYARNHIFSNIDLFDFDFFADINFIFLKTWVTYAYLYD